jgi:hypothetical protein
VQARDGAFDQISCGPNYDQVRADAIDKVEPDCERVVRG